MCGIASITSVGSVVFGDITGTDKFNIWEVTMVLSQKASLKSQSCHQTTNAAHLCMKNHLRSEQADEEHFQEVGLQQHVRNPPQQLVQCKYSSSSFLPLHVRQVWQVYWISKTQDPNYGYARYCAVLQWCHKSCMHKKLT